MAKSLKEYFDSDVVPAMGEMHKRRKSTLIKVIIASVLFATIVGIIFSLSPVFSLGMFLWVSAPFVAMFNVFIHYTLKTQYREDFKKHVVTRILDFLGFKMNLAGDSSVLGSSVEVSGIFINTHDTLDGDNYMEGYIRDVHTKLSQIRIHNSGYTDYIISQGLFIMMPFETDPECNCLIEESKTDDLWDAVTRKIHLEGEKRNFSNKAEFNSRFDVHYEDETGIKELLNNESLTKAIIAYSDLACVPVTYSFTRAYLFIYIPSKHKLFEASMWKDIEFDVFEYWAKCLLIALSAVECIALRTKSVAELKQGISAL